jgi:DNA-binding LytR/AlgR family response regulator
MTGRSSFIERYERWRRPAEVAFWAMVFVINASANSVTVWLDIQRVHLDFEPWEPVVWEWTSNMAMLALVPAIVAFERRWPLTWADWPRHWPAHVAFSVVVSVAHVVVMVAARQLAYRMHGAHYDFGSWPRELAYEYLKDARGYASILATIALYRLALWRLKGEARLLTEPDVGAAVEPVARPERFLVKKLGKEFLLPAQEIEWAQAWGNYVNLHVRGRDHPLRSTLTTLESRLDPERFARVHRSYIVNLGQIAAIEPQDGGDADLLLHSGQRIPCSRTYRESLRGRLAAVSG